MHEETVSKTETITAPEEEREKKEKNTGKILKLKLLNMKSDIFKIALFLLSFLFFSCSVDIPQEYKDLGDEQLEIYPDYKNVTVPCNVAP